MSLLLLMLMLMLSCHLQRLVTGGEQEEEPLPGQAALRSQPGPRQRLDNHHHHHHRHYIIIIITIIILLSSSSFPTMSSVTNNNHHRKMQVLLNAMVNGTNSDFINASTVVSN